MRNLLKTSLFSISLLALLGFNCAQQANAERFYMDGPPPMEERMYEGYPPPPPPAYYGGTEYYGPRPFSLHRFVGNAAFGAVGASKNAVLGSHHYGYYY